MRAPARATRRSLTNVIPNHVLAAHVLSRLPSRDAASWSLVSRNARRSSVPNMARRQHAREQEVTDAVKACVFAFNMAKHNRWGEDIFKEIFDRLPSGQFNVSDSQIYPGDEEHPDFFLGTLYTPHFYVGVTFENWGTTSRLTVNIAVATAFSKELRVRVEDVRGKINKSVTLRGGFPAEWAKGVEQMPLRPRVRQ